MYKRQTAESNTARSNGYKITASAVKKSGHTAEHVYASFFLGKVIKGTGKTDVVCPVYGNTTVKAPAGGKVQMLLQKTDYVGEKWGLQHPMYLASQAQRLFYEDRHFGREQNSTILYEDACAKVKSLVDWMSIKENFQKVLEYALLNDGEIDHVVDMYRTQGKCAYITSAKDFIQIIMDANPVPKQTASGLRISVSVETGGVDAAGNPNRRSAFSFEVRSNSKHCTGFLHKMEGGVIFPLIRKTKYCKQINSPV